MILVSSRTISAIVGGGLVHQLFFYQHPLSFTYE